MTYEDEIAAEQLALEMDSVYKAALFLRSESGESLRFCMHWAHALASFDRNKHTALAKAKRDMAQQAFG